MGGGEKRLQQKKNSVADREKKLNLGRREKRVIIGEARGSTFI